MSKEYQYKCRICGYKRVGLLDKTDYSWNCPKCGNFADAEEIVESKDNVN